MSQYDYLFTEKQLDYNNNIILYQVLIKILEDDNILNKIFIKSNSFLEFVLPHDTILKNIFKKDSLYIYTIIDFFKNNEDIIEKKKNKIKEFLNENNLELLNYLLKNYIDINENLKKKNIYKNMITAKDQYFAIIFNNIWINNFKTFEISNYNIILMAKQILILYYFNEFYDKNKYDQLNFDEDAYQDFLKLLVKYKAVYSDITNENIILKTFDEIPINENKIKLFYKFCLDNKFINKNLLSWFFILFNNELPKYLHNDFYYIIIGIKHNILNVIFKILNYIGIDFYKYDKMKFDELIKNISDDQDYLGKIYENLKFDNSIDYQNITNNIFLIKKLYELHDNIYNFLSDIELNELEINQYYIFILTSPLNNSWKTNLYQIKSIQYSIDLLQIYNSIECNNFTGNCIFLSQKGIIRINNIEKNLINILNQNLDIFDKYIMFLNIINYLSNFEIIPNNKEIILSNYLLDDIVNHYLNIFPKEKEILYNYGN